MAFDVDVGVRLSVFLAFLGSGSQPDAVVRSMLDGPLAAFAATAAALQVARGPDLVTVGAAGDVSGNEVACGSVPLTANVPVVRAFHAGHSIITTASELRSTQPGADSGTLVSSVITTRGCRVGTWWTICDDRTQWTPADLALLDGISAALGLWLTHPDIDRAHALQSSRSGFRISVRQQQILLLIEEGKTTTAIATALGYSESTIKLDLRGVLDKFGVHNRHDAVRAARTYDLLPPPRDDN